MKSYHGHETSRLLSLILYISKQQLHIHHFVFPFYNITVPVFCFLFVNKVEIELPFHSQAKNQLK